MVSKIQDKVEEYAGAAEEAYGDVTDQDDHSARGAARKYASQASYAVKDAADTIKQQVSDKPYAGLAVAAAVGVAFGYLLGRK
ncbi:CsbD family protein [Rosenbergiella sp. S61]|uniref:CsbD family protein n=1 Tax=Rosenbergiella gaditana TaxID=2726987 RepID=A0ABS5SV08_9GAMM|nr:CsbD family protein [Rosenbergiella gaditana]MBT0723273.1 CsbD family protein [Rosenbergiella gaditana]